MAINLKGTSRFMEFDWESFLAGKEFEAVREPELLTDYKTGEVLGARAEVEITSDRTSYGNNVDIDNTGARFSVKLLGKSPDDYRWAGRRVPVRVGSITRASLWAVADGKPKNQLTVEGDIFPVSDGEAKRK